MIAALAYCVTDQAQAKKLIGWMQELGPYPTHELLLFRERRASAIPNAGKGWGKFTEEVFDDPYRRWPISTTKAFEAAARYVEHTSKKPFLWLEPDCVPIRKGWLDELAAEYQRTPTKPFMGAMVPGIGGTPDHLSGISIYPGEMTKFAGQALMLDEEQPFDITACQIIYPQAHFTDLIQHLWDRPPKNLTGEQRLQQITASCVLFHGDKSGNLIDHLRNGETPVEQKEPPRLRMPAEGERNGDLVFFNGGWRNAASAPGSEMLAGKTATSSLQTPKPILDGTNSQPEKSDKEMSPGIAPAVPSKTLSFGSDELQKHLEVALKTDDQLKPISPPWSDKKESEQEVRLLAEALALFCGAPIYKKRVRDALREVKIIK